MKFSTNTILALALALPCVFAAPPAAAGPIKLADVPLMSLEGSGTVKPNLMLIYDDSGSMAFTYTPDNVDDSTSCRAYAYMKDGQRPCEAGDVPYNTPQFNRQYYNPAIRYLPPVRANQTSYPSQTSSATSEWRQVTTDAFGTDRKNLRGVAEDWTNLVTGFPDLEWCRADDADDCKRNIAGYTYPNNTYNVAKPFTANPYYYTLNVNEYCTDATLRNCVSTGVNAAAPNATYATPARVRWCTTDDLDNCQAKFVNTKNGNYKFPRFGDPYRSPNWYTTITINDSGSDKLAQIDRVTADGVAGSEEITSGVVAAASGTNTATKRNDAAYQLAKSIFDKKGLARAFTTCLRSARSPVPACSTYGIDLPADNMVAVIAITCTNANTKTGCTVVRQGERTGDTLTVHSPSGATGLLRFSGTTSNNSRSQTTAYNLRYGSTTYWTNGFQLGRNVGASSMVASMANNIGTAASRTVKAYVGGNAVTPACRAEPDTTLCLVGPSSYAGQTPSLTLQNANTARFTAVTGVNNHLPTSVSGFDTGVFTRTDIVPARNSYPKAVGRTDCAGESCTYAEEMTNFANWYAYYKSRNQMMKTAVGLAMQPLDKDYKVGLVGLQRAAKQTAYMGSDVLLFPAPFTGTQRETWYRMLYEMNPNGGTPVRQALHEIGRMYANEGEFRQAKGQEVVEYACQQNFTFITTDGYWNGPSVSDVVNNDNVANAARFCTEDRGCVDPSAQGKPSLADVALYWYNGGSNDSTKSLNQSLEGEKGQVPGSGNKRLHMRTYALGLGVDGVMTYEPKYDTERKQGGDLDNIIRKVQTGCPWTDDGVYRWPDPRVDSVELSDIIQSRVDDLWHATINGGGKYFSASDTQQVVDGLNEALNDIREATGAAAAAATSTPNLSQEDRDIFSSTFTTVKWTGNLSKREIDLVTGEVIPGVIWSSSWTVGDKVRADSDTRSLWYRDPASGARREFKVGNAGGGQGLGETELAWFRDKCSSLSQCGNLSNEQKALVNQPETIVNWLRGQLQYANGVVLRAYSASDEKETKPQGTAKPVVLGDIASSKPAYLRGARKSYVSAGYDDYKAEQAERDPTVFIAANDGMLHAFDAGNGDELWGYVPRITMQKLHRQASVAYATDHQFTVDGSPELADVQIDGQWRTVLVAGLNGGGRGYYALDVTDPKDPQPLWEICADSSICSGRLHQPEIGFSYGNPQFGTIKDGTDANGNPKYRWVVFLTSGYNNIPNADGVPGGSGKGFLFVVDVKTGEQVLNLGESGTMYGQTGLLTTGSGGTGTDVGGDPNPSGFAKITAITANPNTDPLVTYIYGGDNFGQMWRFDFTGTSVKRVLMGNTGVDQPITSRPDVAMCQVDTTGAGADASPTQRVVAFGTGRLLAYEDIGEKKTQAMYVLNDTGEPLTGTNWRDTSLAERSFTETRPYNAATPLIPRSNEFRIGGDNVDLARDKGWFVEFDKTPGERVNLDPKIVSGTLSVVTNVPASSTACAVGGTSYAYHVDVCTGKAVSGEIAGAILSENAAAVGFIIVRLPSGALKMITTTATGETITSEVTSATAQDARRTGWRRVRD